MGHAGDPVRPDCVGVCRGGGLATDLFLKDESQGESDGLQEQQHAEDTEELRGVEMVKESAGHSSRLSVSRRTAQYPGKKTANGNNNVKEKRNIAQRF